MKKFYRGSLAAIILMLTCAAMVHAQTSISGKISDAVSGEPLAGVNIVVKGRVIGTITDGRGEFNLKVNDTPPLTVTLSFVGYRTQGAADYRCQHQWSGH